jgi:hypothetical protein
MTLTAAPRRRASPRSKEARRPDATLGVALEWIERHCVVPDGFKQGAPFKLYDYQVTYLGNFYTVRGTAEWQPDNPVKGEAFKYRRAMMVGPQKLGKDPMVAAQVALEGVGPALFGGWAGRGEGWACREHGCRCGWEYPYDEGEPRGMAWPTALIQVTAFSEKATENTYDALRPMIENGPLADLIPKTGEQFIRLPNGGRIDTVTSESRSRLGNRITHASQGELGIWDQPTGMQKVADTQWRGLAGMGGRASATTNAWDPGQRSTAQGMYEAAEKDVYIQFVQPPALLSFADKTERKRILRAVYPRDTLRDHGGHVDLDAIEAEAGSLVARGDPAPAARFFGNQLVTGSGRAFDTDVWKSRARPEHTVPDRAYIVIGGDGSKSDDTTALVGCEVLTGHLFSLGTWDPHTLPGGRVPASEVTDAIEQASTKYRVLRLWFDPPYWGDELAAWEAKWGDKVVKGWATGRNAEMGWACRRFATAVADGTLTHDGDATMAQHIGNAHKRALLVRDDTGEALWAIQKETRDSGLKIDAATAAVVANEARLDAIASGEALLGGPSVYETRGVFTF